MDQDNQSFDFTSFRDLLTIVFKHKYKILITFLFILAGATIFAYQIKPAYEANSVLLVKFGGREYSLRPEETTLRSGLETSVPTSAIINGEIGILKSRDLLTRVASETGIGLGALEKNLKAGNLPSSNLIGISFTDANPGVAANVLNRVVDLFKERHLEVFSSDGNEYLEKQLRISQKRLAEAQANLSGLKQKYSLFSPEGQNTQLISLLGTLNASLVTTQNQITELEQKVTFVQSGKWSGDSSPEIRAQLTALHSKERELLGKYRENSTAVQNVRREIQALKDSVKGSSQEFRESEISKAESELVITRAKADNLKRKINQVQRELQNFNAHDRELQEMTRAVAISEQDYKIIARKLEESNALEDMDRRKMVSIRVVEKAAVPGMPKKTKLNKPTVITAGFFGGIAAGIGLAFLLEFVSACMTTPRSAERRLGLPVMVAIAQR
jgi:polysaccharide biosynthesis protein PslE